MINIPCVILAGGRSSRMEEDKCFLPFSNNKTLIEYQHDKLSKIFSKVYVSSKPNKFKTKLNYNLILDDNELHSPLIALNSIFEKIQEEKVFIITVDVPFIEKSTIIKLIEKNKDFDITIAKDKNIQHNLLGVFNKSVNKSIKQNIKNNIHKINYLIKNSNSNIIEFENEKEFLNMNTKEHYQQALKNLI